MASNRRYSLSRVNHSIDNDEKSALANAKLSSNQGFHPKHRRFSSGDRKHFKVDSLALAVPMDRNSMLLVEANEISQYLQLDYAFSKHDSSDSIEEVQVLDKKEGSFYIWTIAKLKEKLIKMRKLMYTNDTGNSQSSATAVLLDVDMSKFKNAEEAYNAKGYSSLKESEENLLTIRNQTLRHAQSDGLGPSDVGLTSVKVNSASPSVSPALQSSPISSAVQSKSPQSHSHEKHLPIRSISSHELKSAEKPNGIPEKYLTGPLDEEAKKTNSGSLVNSSSRSTSKAVAMLPRIKDPMHPERNHSLNLRRSPGQRKALAPQPQAQPSADAEAQTDASLGVLKQFSTYTVCKDLTTMALKRFSYGNSRVSVIDRILCTCESIRQGIQQLISDQYSSKLPSNDMQLKTSMECGDVERISVQVTISLEVLISHILTLFALLSVPNDSVVAEYQQSMLYVVKELTKDIVTLWQSCEKAVDEIVSDSVVKILNLIQQLCVECGKMSAVLDLCPQTLADPKAASLEQMISQKSVCADDLLNAKPCHEVKRSFLAGCDIIVDKSLQHCLHLVEILQNQMKSLTEQCQNDNNNNFQMRLLRQFDPVVASCRAIFFHLQQIQIDLYSKGTEEMANSRPTNYYQSYFDRCISMVSKTQKLVDSLELLKQTVQPVLTGIDSGILRKISRCAEIVQHAADRLLQISVSLSVSPLDSRMNSSGSHPSLDPNQEGKLNEQRSRLIQATRALGDLVKDKLERDYAAETPSSGDKVKRLLPVTPSRMQIMRSQSAKIFDQQPKLLKQFSLSKFSPRYIDMRNISHRKQES